MQTFGHHRRRKMSLDRMPLEIIATIAAYLSKYELLMLTNTCRRLRNIARSGGFVFQIADYAHDDLALHQSVCGIACVLRKPHSVPKTKKYDLRFYAGSGNVVVPPIDNPKSCLCISGIDVFVQSYVARIALSSIPKVLRARTDELKIVLSQTMFLEQIQEWTVWPACKRLILIALEHTMFVNPNRHDIFVVANYIDSVSRRVSNKIKTTVIIEAALSVSEISAILRMLPGVSRFKFRCRYYYTRLADYRFLSKRVYIRRMCNMYELNVWR